MTVKLTETERRVLELMGPSGGYTAGGIAKALGSRTRSEMACFKSAWLEPMRRAGLLRPMDSERPMIYTATDLGKTALSTEAPASSKEEGE